MDDLIARLLAFEVSDEIGNGDFSLMQEAADALVDVQEIKDQLDWTVKENDLLLIEGRELTSRVKQLEEALRGAIDDLRKYQHAAAAGRWSHALKEITGSSVLNATSKGESQ